VNHLHVLEAPQWAQQMAQAQASDLTVGDSKLQTNRTATCWSMCLGPWG
jgi:hypothetical protein